MNSIDRRSFINLTSKGVIMSTLAPAALFYSGSTKASSRNIFEETDSNIWVEYFADFTSTYKKYSDNIYRRELESLKMQMPMQMCRIQPGDLLAGRVEILPNGFTPQSDSGSFAYYMHEGKISQLLNDLSLSVTNKKVLNELSEFWKKEDTKVKVRGAYPEAMASALTSDRWNQESGIA
ncbi:MAG: hypothetical protein R3182_15655, partial [Draconibacterium sp.]|nr:hypothetical protein [Draconibacterium sp.]